MCIIDIICGQWRLNPGFRNLDTHNGETLRTDTLTIMLPRGNTVCDMKDSTNTEHHVFKIRLFLVNSNIDDITPLLSTGSPSGLELIARFN